MKSDFVTNVCQKLGTKFSRTVTLYIHTNANDYIDAFNAGIERLRDPLGHPRSRFTKSAKIITFQYYVMVYLGPPKEYYQDDIIVS